MTKKLAVTVALLAEAGVEITADASWAAMTSGRGPKQTHNMAA
jgi:hypothetical protein